jgi:hypothetical protein
MLGAIGLPELIIVAVIAFLVVLPTLRLRSASGQSAFMNGAGFIAPPGAAIADSRYVHGVSAGNLATLFGIGRAGLRWGQIAAVTVGVFFSNNAGFLAQLTVPGMADGVALLAALGSPVFFVAAAILAIRSFQTAPAVVVATGAIYTLLKMSMRFAIASNASVYDASDYSDYWLRMAAGSFVWATLTMIALHFAVAGGQRWLRMIAALAIAALAANILWTLLFVGETFDSQLAMALVNPWPVLLSSLVMTAGFWVGVRIAGE